MTFTVYNVIMLILTWAILVAAVLLFNFGAHKK